MWQGWRTTEVRPIWVSTNAEANTEKTRVTKKGAGSSRACESIAELLKMTDSRRACIGRVAIDAQSHRNNNVLMLFVVEILKA